MIVRYTCRLGDMTTSGGTVIGDGPHRMSVYGQKAAIEGDSVSCPACHTMGAIRAVGPRLSVRIDGRLIALNDDECECACWPRPRLLSSQTNHKQRIEPDPPRPSAPAASPESPARTKSAPRGSPRRSHYRWQRRREQCLRPRQQRPWTRHLHAVDPVHGCRWPVAARPPRMHHPDRWP